MHTYRRLKEQLHHKIGHFVLLVDLVDFLLGQPNIIPLDKLSVQPKAKHCALATKELLFREQDTHVLGQNNITCEASTRTNNDTQGP
jgi:hypothetical protein